MNTVRKHSLLSFIILLICSNVTAQLNWNFTTAASSSGTIYNTTAGSVTQVNNNGSTTFIGAGSPISGLYTGASGGNNGSFSAKTGAVNTGTSTYMQVILTPAANYSLSITGISWGNYSVSTSGPTLVSVYTSIDNYTAPVCSTTVLQNSTWTLLTPTFLPVTAENGKPVTIRIYASGGTGSVPAAGTANWRIDDLKISAKSLPVTETIYMSMKNAASAAAAVPWNNIAGLTSNNLKNGSDITTSVGLEFLSGSWSNTGDKGRITGNNSGVYPDAVIRDYYWCGAYGAPDTMTANIKGLDTSAKYNITLFGSSMWNGVANNGTTIYSVNGVAKGLYVDSNYLNTVSFNNIKPTNAGIIQFRFYKGQFAPYALMNALVLEKLLDSSSLPAGSWYYGGNTVGSIQKLGTIDNIDLPVITNDAERMRIKADGKIGIGTASPDSTLHVVGGFKLVNGSQGTGKVLTSDASGAARWQTAASVLNFENGITKTNDTVRLGGLATEPIRITGAPYYLLRPDVDTTATHHTMLTLGRFNDVGYFDVKTAHRFNADHAYISASNMTGVSLGHSSGSMVKAGTDGNVTLAGGNVAVQNGTFQYDHSSKGDGKVLTSDAFGVATWQTPATGSDLNSVLINGNVSDRDLIIGAAEYGVPTLKLLGGSSPHLQINDPNTAKTSVFSHESILFASNSPSGLKVIQPNMSTAGATILNLPDPGAGTYTLATTDDITAGGNYTASSGIVLQGKNFKIADSISGAGYKFMWTPAKGAFRAGRAYADEWDMNNIADYSTSFGYYSRASGVGSFTAGYGVQARTTQSAAIGGQLLAKGWGSIVVGTGNDTSSAENPSAWTATNRAFQVGIGENGTGPKRKNAMTVLFNGKTGLGTVNPDSTLHIAGGFKYQHPTAGAGKVLISDASGGASWQTPGNSIPTFTHRSVPYANSAGVLVEDNTGLAYTGNDLVVGHSDFYSTTGISINGGRGYFGASGFGMTIKTNGGTPGDASKAINFYNSNRRYLKLFMKADSTLNMESDVTIYPTVTNQRSLGQAANQWLNTYSQNLFVNGSLKFNIPGSSAGYVLTSDASGNATWQPAIAGSSQWTSSGTATYLTNTSGRVMIGTPALIDTNFRLFVTKGIRTQKVKVDQATWADFVFDDDYQLPSLNSIAQYIKTHKHLPGVPAAEEVTTQGLDLGEMQKILLQKIEELTLYTIELENKNKEQEGRLKKAEQSRTEERKLLQELLKKVDLLDKEIKKSSSK